MRFKDFLSRFDALRAENRLLRFGFAVLLAVSLLNSAGLYWAWKHERTVLVPPGLDARTAVRDGWADEQYLSVFARYAAGLALNYSPATIRRQAEELLLLYDPEFYPEGKVQLYALVDRVTETKMASLFHPQRITVDTGRRQIEVTGNRAYFADDRKVDSGVKTYVIEYRFNLGRFAIAGIYEKKGGDTPPLQQPEGGQEAKK